MCSLDDVASPLLVGIVIVISRLFLYKPQIKATQRGGRHSFLTDRLMVFIVK